MTPSVACGFQLNITVEVNNSKFSLKRDIVLTLKNGAGGCTTKPPVHASWHVDTLGSRLLNQSLNGAFEGTFEFGQPSHLNTASKRLTIQLTNKFGGPLNVLHRGVIYTFFKQLIQSVWVSSEPTSSSNWSLLKTLLIQAIINPCPQSSL